MLTEKQQTKPVKGLTASDCVILLHLIARATNARVIHDSELFAVGKARNNLSKAMKDATGIDFDQTRAKLMDAQAQAEKPAMPAPEKGNSKNVPVIENE